MKNFIRLISFYINCSKKLYVTDNLQKLYSWRKPVKPYAFIRVCNEIKTIDVALHSILPCVKGGVIGFNSCTDGSKEYILDFCKKYPQFIPAEYPYDVIPGSDPAYKEDNIDINNRLDSYYNFVWDKLPNDEWIIKVDVDHIWFPKYLNQLCQLAIRKRDFIILNRINIHVDNGICYINKRNPLTEVGDSWILYKHKSMKFGFMRGWLDNVFYAWEFLPKPERNRIYGPLSNYHFPIIKAQRNKFRLDEWIPLKEFDIKQYIKENNMDGRVDMSLLEESFIIEQFNLFQKEQNLYKK